MKIIKPVKNNLEFILVKVENQNVFGICKNCSFFEDGDVHYTNTLKDNTCNICNKDKGQHKKYFAKMENQNGN